MRKESVHLHCRQPKMGSTFKESLKLMTKDVSVLYKDLRVSIQKLRLQFQ